MPNTIACYKWVIDEADVRVGDDLSVDVSRAKMKISDYDRNAIQAAVDAAAALGGKAFGLSYGDSRLKKSVKEALSRGLDELVWVSGSDAADADASATACVLTAAVREQDDIALVVCADGSSDQFARQTAPRMAAGLGWPVVTGVSSLSIDGTTLSATRQIEDGLEEVEVELPVVVSVLPEVAEPPIPGLRQIMEAGKKPNQEVAVDSLSIDASAKTRVVQTRGYAMDRKNIVLDGADEGCVAELMAALRKEGVL